MAFGAIALNAARRAGKSGARIALQGLVDRQGEFAVGACRDRSRQVVGHKHNDNPASFHASPVIPKNGKRAYGRAPQGRMSEPIRQPRDRLTRQPQEREHSDADRRHAGPTASGEGCHSEREGSSPDGRDPASRVRDLPGLGERSD